MRNTLDSHSDDNVAVDPLRRRCEQQLSPILAPSFAPAPRARYLCTSDFAACNGDDSMSIISMYNTVESHNITGSLDPVLSNCGDRRMFIRAFNDFDESGDAVGLGTSTDPRWSFTRLPRGNL